MLEKIFGLFGYVKKKQEPIFTEPWWNYYSTLGVPRPKTINEQIQAYKSWVYSCVNIIAQRIASLEIRLIKVTMTREGKKTEEIYDHPFLDLLWRPNPLMTRFEFMEKHEQFMELTGNSYWLILPDRLGIPREMYLLRPDYTQPLVSKSGEILGYKYRVGTDEYTFPPDMVLHHKFPNPESDVYGASPIQAQAYSYDINLYIQVYQRDFFEKGAMVDLALETDMDLTEDQIQRLRKQFKARHHGLKNSRDVLVLTNKMKAKPLTIPNKDLEFALLAEWTRDQILAAYGVPASKLGLVKDVNRANAEANDYTFNRECILPRIMRLEERLETFLLPRYPQGDNWWLELEFENPVPEDKEFELKKKEVYLRNGVYTINEVRGEEGLPETEWGKVPYLPATLMPIASEPQKAVKKLPEKKIIDDVRREAIWKGFVARTLPYEKKLVSTLKDLFAKQEKEVLENLEKEFPKIHGFFHGWKREKKYKYLRSHPEMIDAVLFDREKWLKIFQDQMFPILMAVIEENGKNAVQEVGGDEFQLHTEAQVNHFREKEIKIVNINDTTREDIRKTLKEGIAEGEGVEKLAKRVRDVFEDCQRRRSYVIARTEVAGSANFASVEGYKQAGVLRKEWLSARDERVRETHSEADGQVVPINSVFQVGDAALEYPGDPKGPAGEVIQCRCTVIPVVGED